MNSTPTLKNHCYMERSLSFKSLSYIPGTDVDGNFLLRIRSIRARISLFEVTTAFLSLPGVHKTQNKHCGGLLPGPGSANLAANSGQKCLLTSSSEDLLLAPNGLFTPAEIEEWLFTYSKAFCFVTYFIDPSFFHIFSKKDNSQPTETRHFSASIPMISPKSSGEISATHWKFFKKREVNEISQETKSSRIREKSFLDFCGGKEAIRSQQQILWGARQKVFLAWIDGQIAWPRPG